MRNSVTSQKIAKGEHIGWEVKFYGLDGKTSTLNSCHEGLVRHLTQQFPKHEKEFFLMVRFPAGRIELVAGWGFKRLEENNSIWEIICDCGEKIYTFIEPRLEHGKFICEQCVAALVAAT